jgi:4-amino-4-deoxy-L-arabinose transferase-like glycosyltransferase
LGAFSQILEPDAAQYAEISWEMSLSHNWLQVFSMQKDYLDKPPLLFWITAFCFKIFGVGNFTYRLPSLAFASLAVFSTHRFARLFYEENVARMAALILASTQAFFMLTYDVRTDTLLMGTVIFSLWQMAIYLENRKLLYLFLASAGVGLAMLTKGPIGILVPVFTFLPILILKKEWNKIFDWKYVLALLIIGLLLFPMCIGLYQQFGKEGLRFYFWTQSFGRITGENVWKNNPDPFFLAHSTLWAFLPWSLFLLVGLFLLAKKAFSTKDKTNLDVEFYSLSGFLLTAISLMLSKYQLPHYIFVVYPLGAIMAAAAINRTTYQWINPLQLVVVTGMWVVIAGLNFYLFFTGVWVLVVFCICMLTALFLFYNSKSLFLFSYASILSANILMNVNINPQLLSYQPSQEIGTYLLQHKIPREQFREYHAGYFFSLAFYWQRTFRSSYILEHIEEAVTENKVLYVLTDEEHFQQIKQHAGWQIEPLSTHYKYMVSQLNWKFLNPSTRVESSIKLHFIKVIQI